MTNLLLSYNGIPGMAVTITGATFDEDMALGNLFHGPRYLRGKEAAASATSVTLTFDLGTGLSSSADHLIIARADLLKAAGVTAVSLKTGSTSTYASATGVYSDVSFATATLYGPNSNDYIATSTASYRDRYWFLTYTKGASSDLEHSKVYFGSSFDFGVDPDFEPSRLPRSEGEIITDSGATILSRVDEPAYVWDFTWTGVTDGLLAVWIERFVAKKNKERFFLYTVDNHAILDGKRIVHVELTDASYSKTKTGINVVSASFKEIAG